MKYRKGEQVMGLGRFSLVMLIAILLLWPLAAAAEDLVSGRYLKGAGKEIVVELEISSPAPPLVIVVQNLPKGIKVISSSPELKKYNPKKGVAKWLLREAKPGKMTVSLQLDRPVAKDTVHGEIRCRDAGGKMVSVDLEN